jgi:tetratricopeptide (TPR) repeat protein
MHELAIKAYERTLEIDPGFAFAHYSFATLLMQKGKKDAAIFHFEKALENPSNIIDVQKAKEFLADLKKQKPEAGEASP